MYRVKSIVSSVVIEGCFAPFIFDWGDSSGRFCKVVHSALSNQTKVGPSDFEEQHGLSFADNLLRFNFPGSSLSFTLTPDQLAIRFIDIKSEDLNLVMESIQSIVTGFQKEFPEVHFEDVRCSLHEHLKCLGDSSITEFLSRFAFFSSKEKENKNSTTVVSPCARFTVTNQRARWYAECSADRSLRYDNALFVSAIVEFLRVPQSNLVETCISHFTDFSFIMSDTLELDMVND